MGVMLREGTIVARKGIRLACLKKTRPSHLQFVVLHLPSNLHMGRILGSSTSGITSSFTWWVFNQKLCAPVGGRGMSTGNIRMWEGKTSLIRISKVVRGPKKMHYFIYYTTYYILVR